jgi:uroporphyrinogen decarboxylase
LRFLGFFNGGQGANAGSYLTSRQRVQLSIGHKEPDRVPLILGGCTSTTIAVGAYQRLRKHLGLSEETIRFMSVPQQIVFVAEDVMQALEIDIRPVAEKPARNSSSYDPGDDSVTDEWGVVWKRPKGGLYYDIVKSPLENAGIDDLGSHAWPDPLHPDRSAGIAEQARELFENSPYALYGNVPGNNIFERAWYMRGLENFMVDLLVNPEFARALMRKITDVHKARTRKFLDVCGKYLQIFRTGDDIASQNSLLVSHETYCEMIKPFQKEYFSLIKDHTDAKIIYHICGAVAPLIDDLMEIGVDILNPVQVSSAAIDPAGLKRKYGTGLSFCGAIDTQKVLPTGSPEDVEEEVRNRIRVLGPGGGYLLAAVHNIQSDVPAENIVAMFSAGKKYGNYPISL